jgi:hypothetical protein
MSGVNQTIATGPRPVDAPTGGEEVGTHLTLAIAGQRLGFRTNDPRIRFFLHYNHDPFRVADEGPVDCELIWSVGPVEASAGAPARVAGERWELRWLPDGREEVVFFAGHGAGRREVMRVVADPDYRTVEMTQVPRDGDPYLAFASEYPWSEWVIQRRLGIYGGAMIHASMAVLDGGAYLFMGHSGAGKSTIAELAETVGAWIPTDDRTILTVDGGEVTAWGTPWHGSLARTSGASAPVRSISLLVQATEDRLEPIVSSRAIKEMFVRTVQAAVTPREVHSTMQSLEAIASAIPIYELHFRPTAAAVRLVLAAHRDRGGKQ